MAEKDKEIQEIRKEEVKYLTSEKNKSTQNIIIHNYPNAPNLSKYSDKEFQDEEMSRFIDMGIQHGLVELLKSMYIDDVPPEKRSFWCIDPSRDKSVIMENGEWIVDVKSTKLRKVTNHVIRRKVKLYLSKRHEELRELNYSTIMDLREAS